jgi:Asp-tRNA(Asn)/Glu-tRNA(Gln) amidotransferase A subunit family amidase
MSGISRRDFIQTSAAGVLMIVPQSLPDGAPTQGASAMAGQDLCFMSATTLAAAIRAKRVSPVEVVKAIYARIHQINPRINAFCTLTEELARQRAKEAKAAVMRGDRLGALHGVPVSVKDVFLTRGVRTMFGSRIRENYVPEEDAPAVSRLLTAGAILIGKTTTPEFAFKPVTDSPLTGITRNPWDLKKTPGGSSGGACAAVAAGLGPIAIGSDAGGSIRAPSSFTGIFGLKPSFGRVAYYPSAPVPLVHAGPMGRTVRDAALMLTVIAGPDERDLVSLPVDATDYLSACEGGIRGLRVGWSPALGYAKVDPQVGAITEAAANAFENSLGCKVEAADPGFESPWESLSVLMVMNFALRFRGFLPDWESRMDSDLVKLIRNVERLGPADFGEALAKRVALWDTIRKFFDRFDLLLTPTLPITAFEAGRPSPDGMPVPAGSLIPFADWSPFTYPWNITGQPAASVPCGFTREGLPVGLQIVGRRFADAIVLKAAAAFEQVRPWNEKRPSL